MKTIGIYTPYRKGGPWYWGQRLVKMINTYSQDFSALHSHRLLELLASPVLARGDIIQSVNPITYKLWKKPYILTIKGNYLQEKSNFFSRFYPEAEKRADVVVVPSLYLKKALRLNRALIIPNAVEITNFPSVDLRPKKKEPLEILTVTKFYFKDKSLGVLKILNSLDEIKNKYNLNFNYTVLGAGQWLNHIKEKAKKYNFPINFVGFEKPQKYLKKADIFAYYSTHDNMPNAVMEAMSSGLPVISNPIGAVPEIINHEKNGLLAEGNYTKNLLNLISSYELRKELGHSARNTITSNYSWNKIIYSWEKLYREVI